jgi:hypothetical protein
MRVPELSSFFVSIRSDNRISTSHISLYMALFECWNQNDFQNPVFIRRQQVMESAKISGLATYHRCMRELHEYGYINYFPSYNPAICSTVTFSEKG